MTGFRRVPAGIPLALLLACARAPGASPGGVPEVEWPSSAGDAGSQRYAPLDDITPANVTALQRAWTWRTGEVGVADPATGRRLAPGSFEATPVMLHDTLYLSTPFRRAVALDATSGRELWSFDPGMVRWGRAGLGRQGFVHRGVAVWSGDAHRRVFLTARWRLYALDATTGAPIPSFGEGGFVNLLAGLEWPADSLQFDETSPPALWHDVVIVGSAVSDRFVRDRDTPGDVQAFDARTGQRLWTWHPIPPRGSPDRADWTDEAASVTGHMNVWAPISVDDARGLVYLPVSTPSNDWYGGNRPGANRYAESVVCLEARTGRTVWAQQLVHHGLWDYDLANPPILTTIRTAHDTSDVVVILGKTGFVYAFDRVTGAPHWPITEHAVPTSDVPGEVAFPTQPMPDWPKPFARQGFDSSEIADFTPEVHRLVLAALDSAHLVPIFSPPSLAGTVVMPGWIGGAGWGAGAVDPERQLLLIKATNLASLARLIPNAAQPGYRFDPHGPSPGQLAFVKLPPWRKWYGVSGALIAVPINRPPYGTLTAIDLATGAQRWQITLGDSPLIKQHPLLRGLDLPALGVPGPPGGVVTRSGLIFITGGGGVLYAIDVATGEVRWSAPLGQQGYSNPMTYRAGDGRQYVVVATGGDVGASLQAFSLSRGR
jgi:quinoprotein glucose dehydrogenase